MTACYFDAALRTQPIVQKYGGTSVGSVERIQNIAHRIAGHHRAGFRQLAIVVSAQAGETNRLVELIGQVNPRAPKPAYDMALAAGEQVSVALAAAALAGAGMDAVPLLGHQLGILTDNFHSRARIQSIRTDAIRHCWQRGQIPVIAGFQGVTEDAAITTLGRGGSDTSAVALAAALDAGLCEINTDVDGVFTADPRKVPAARLIPLIDYEVALEMAALGSKVLHPRCVELGRKFRLPMVVRNTFKPDSHEGTRIMMMSTEQRLEAPVVSGVTLDPSVVRFTIEHVPNAAAAVARIFRAISDANVNVDIIVFNREGGAGAMEIGFTVGGADQEATAEALQGLREDGPFQQMGIRTVGDLAKVSVVGVGMQGHAGVATRTFQALTQADIEMQMVSTSEIKISCVVPSRDGERAMQVLHAAFIG